MSKNFSKKVSPLHLIDLLAWVMCTGFTHKYGTTSKIKAWEGSNCNNNLYFSHCRYITNMLMEQKKKGMQKIWVKRGAQNNLIFNKHIGPQLRSCIFIIHLEKLASWWHFIKVVAGGFFCTHLQLEEIKSIATHVILNNVYEHWYPHSWYSLIFSCFLGESSLPR